MITNLSNGNRHSKWDKRRKYTYIHTYTHTHTHTQTHTRTHTHTSLRKKDLYMGKFTRTVKNILRLGAKKS